MRVVSCHHKKTCSNKQTYCLMLPAAVKDYANICSRCRNLAPKRIENINYHPINFASINENIK
ncbi:hypothetical protein CWI36_0966p0020 [Hamiltosporidium magnivora]|uniref:Uncharacterized protein n=1 Tax=Hamiltosporidium magnivora TaxID=148818 RepID=A0A4V2JVB1_9MICR|nr:hypothetical protein CWI36_0966p0020 [Hamiltosporidium magnivora]